jgi:hypothetical protein
MAFEAGGIQPAAEIAGLEPPKGEGDIERVEAALEAQRKGDCYSGCPDDECECEFEEEQVDVIETTVS